MKLNIDIGNPNTGDWEDSKIVEFEDYQTVFPKIYPGLPYPESIPHCLALFKHRLALRDEDVVFLTANYTPSTDDYTLAVLDSNDVPICQVMGKASVNESSGYGLSLIFTVTSTGYPVNISICS